MKKNKKLKWTYLPKMKTYISDGENYAIESYKGNKSFDMRITFNEYQTVHLPFKKLSVAKKVAELIYNSQ